MSYVYIEINFNIINIINIMLNLFKLYYNKKTEKKNIDPQEKHNKHYPSAVREWNNSIYVFNKNTIN